MNSNQKEFMKFLEHSSEEHPMPLKVAFGLGPDGDPQRYEDYLEISCIGNISQGKKSLCYIDSNKKGAWLTKEGKAAWETEKEKNRKIRA